VHLTETETTLELHIVQYNVLLLQSETDRCELVG